ncbi:MFS transporter [Xylariaceae sp. FL0016]|nr:MFS transporter [Xylariaceae sp. FL0016]
MSDQIKTEGAVPAAEQSPDIAKLEATVSHDEVDGGKDQRTNYDLVDKELAAYVSDAAVEVDEATNARLKKLVDRRILAVMIVTYFLQSVDKGALGFASIMGFQEDTGLVGQQYSWLTTIIYLTILVVEYPENWIIQRVPIAKWLGANVICWGTVVSLTAACSNWASLMAVRSLLGAFEAACQPSFTVLTAMWYKRSEQAGTIVLWYMMNGVQQILGGLVAFIFSHVPDESKVKSWQALFMFHGLVAICWGVIVLLIMPDSPMKAKCYSEEDKKLMIERVRGNRTGVQNKKFRKEHVYEALKDPQVYGFIGIQLFTTLPSGGQGAYAAIVIKSLGYNVWQTQLLQMVTGVVQIIAMLSSVYIDRRYKNATIYAAMASVVPTIAGTVVLCVVTPSPSSRVGLLIAWYTMISYWAGVGLGLSLVTRNVAGQTKKTVVVAANFMAWCVGNSIGPQVFRARDAPRYFPAFSIWLVCFVLLELTFLAMRFYYVAQNRKKDQKIARGEAVADVANTHGFEDITDKENVNFRYQY